MRFELFLSDYCNFQCWYCSKDFNGKTVSWPKLDVLLPNFLHLLDYYKAAGKETFIIHIGGEPSTWPGLIKFVTEIKKHHNCIISLTTNGSRTLRWWNQNVKHFDSLNGYNNFKGWTCNVGVETAFIDKKGNIRGSCGNKLYNKDFYYNIYDPEFKISFKPIIGPVECKMSSCYCQPEVNCTKRIPNDTLET